MQTTLAKLGEGQIWAEKPFVLLDDYNRSYQGFETLEEAVSSREMQAKYVDKWAACKLILRFNAPTASYELTGETTQQHFLKAAPSNTNSAG
jgi:hypothetical protein